MRTSPRCLARLRPNFRWWSGSWSGTFISGTGPIGQGTGEKRAGNLNFGRFTLKEGSCFGQCFGLVWFPGGAQCHLLVPGGHWVVRGCPWVLLGSCQVVIGCQNNVLESLGKGNFCPLAPRGMGSRGAVPDHSEELDPQWCKAGEKSVLG